MRKQRPVIAVTMGDPAGIGPEIITKAVDSERVRGCCRLLIVGDAQRLRLAAEVSGIDFSLPVVPGAATAEDGPEVGVVQVGSLPPDLSFGEVTVAGGLAAFDYVARAVELTRARAAAAICTAPLNKESMNKAGKRFPGHTELLAELAGVEEVSMMLSTPELNVIHVTTHIGLLDAIERIEPGLVHRTIARGDRMLRAGGLDPVRIGVCGINPHAGEHGLFGRGEEEDKIEPAIAAARADGLEVDGPLPADTLFFRARRGDFDLVVAMYHDQGHGPVKVLGLEAGVNITVGLPFVRTSVDHGTAFDIAGKGLADERGMIEAICRAAELTGGST